MDEDSNAIFKIPMFNDPVTVAELAQQEVIREVSVTKPAETKISFATDGATLDTRQIFDELTAVSEEVLKCRNAAISQLM